MFNWLIIALGGYTERDKTSWEVISNSWRDRCLAAETTVELFKDIVQRERARSDKIESDLRERMFPSETKPPNMKPIGNTISSWPRIKRELERQNRNPNSIPTKEEVTENPGA
jgi:hypothetical protein